MNSDLNDALRLIAAKGDPNISRQAAQALLSTATRQVRFNTIAPVFLGNADLTDEERELIASNIKFEGETRDYTLRVRLTDVERFELEAMAEASDMTLSDYVRSRLFSS